MNPPLILTANGKAVSRHAFHRDSWEISPADHPPVGRSGKRGRDPGSGSKVFGRVRFPLKTACNGWTLKPVMGLPEAFLHIDWSHEPLAPPLFTCYNSLEFGRLVHPVRMPS